MKNILVLGSGAQGSTVVQTMNSLSNVGKIVCADYDINAAKTLSKQFKKAIAARVNAKNLQDIIALKQYCDNKVDLLVNALPLDYAKNALDAALVLKCDYQDFAAGEKIHGDWISGIKYMFDYYHKAFKKNNKLAIIGTGSAPGLICLATRIAVNQLDTCDTIYNFCFEGVRAKRFIPFWFSPRVALSDMAEDAFAYINGKIMKTKAFSLPISRKYQELSKTEIFVEHAHDEPVYYGLNAKTLYKGCKNAYFKYGGIGVDFAFPLHRAGLLSYQPVTYQGQQIVPFEFVLSQLPPAPKFKDEIKAIIKDGIIEDGGCMVVEAYGKKNKQNKLIELHIFAPGIIESFKKKGITAEQYLTGQSGAMYTRMFIENKYSLKGLISSDMLTNDEIKYYWSLMKHFNITYKIIEKKLTKKLI